MSTSRRTFIRTAVAGAAAPVFGPRLLDTLERRLEAYQGLPPAAAATEEAFWREVRKAFPPHPDYINLENGYSSPQPMPTWDAFQRHEQTVNNGLSFYMRRRRAADLASVKQQLAALAGCPAEEIVITRNTTESLGTVIHGVDLEPGDEAVMCDQDYGTMLEQFRQQSRRRGLKCVEIQVPLHPRDDQEIVDTYARAITPRTKLLLLSHMINISGQILPVRKIADMAHARGVAVIVDAAHSFAHVVFAVPDLDGDYLGASLHKWLCTPLGAGLLHVKKEKIRGVWPLFGDTSVPDDDIRKLERIGTQPVWTVMAIADAIRFHNLVGGARKEARLRYLQQYWTDRVRDVPRVYLNTPSGARACGIANVGITGQKPGAIADALLEKHRIFTVAIDTAPVKGVRVTPHLYTTTDELDALVKAIRELAAA
jgi:selenocysteine lyase/cysteine desulfurase